MTHLDRAVLSAWAATAPLHQPNPGAAPGTVEAVERVLGRRLPQALHELYVVHDGGSWLHGNLNLSSLQDETEQVSIARGSETYRGWDWPVPDEVVVFGNDGASDIFGLWLPDTDARPLVAGSPPRSDAADEVRGPPFCARRGPPGTGVVIDGLQRCRSRPGSSGRRGPRVPGRR